MARQAVNPADFHMTSTNCRIRIACERVFAIKREILSRVKEK